MQKGRAELFCSLTLVLCLSLGFFNGGGGGEGKRKSGPSSSRGG